MCRLILFSFLVSLNSLEFVVIPDYEPWAETLFSKGEVKDYVSASLWDKVRFLLNKEGHTITAATSSELKTSKMDSVYIIWNFNNQKLKKISKKNLILLVFEPPSVMSKLHEDEYLDKFSKVLTWEDRRVDGKKFIKYYHPVCYPMISDTILFNDRKLCTIMAANKKSKYKGEIYTERRKAIQYFNQYPSQFDLYGPGWEKEKYSTYCGIVDSKIDALRRYKFSFCYENTVGMNGYITEKIFDCFLAGVIPVYLGAPNILEEVPANCFIDKRNFATYKDLHNYLLSISEEEFTSYIENIRLYLASEKAKAYTCDNFARTITAALLK